MSLTNIVNFYNKVSLLSFEFALVSINVHYLYIDKSDIMIIKKFLANPLNIIYL